MKEAERITAHLCMTKDIGVEGNLFGGVMLSWMDEAAALFAHQYTRMARVVTLKYAELLFKRPVRVGDLVEFYVRNPKLGRSSLTFDIEALVGEHIVLQTSTTFVAVDEAGHPTAIDRTAR